MMDIREVGVFVGDGRMRMEMAVRFLVVPRELVLMLVVRVVNVTMRMFQRFMEMFMDMVF